MDKQPELAKQQEELEKKEDNISTESTFVKYENNHC